VTPRSEYKVYAIDGVNHAFMCVFYGDASFGSDGSCQSRCNIQAWRSKTDKQSFEEKFGPLTSPHRFVSVIDDHRNGDARHVTCVMCLYSLTLNTASLFGGFV
jgi:hypothetical protein